MLVEVEKVVAEDAAGIQVKDHHHEDVWIFGLLISLGAHPKAIMERLGHSDITVTLNVYGHLLPSLEEQLTDGLDELYRSTTTSDDPITATGESAGGVVDLRPDDDR